MQAKSRDELEILVVWV